MRTRTILYDLTRLITRFSRPAPNGIDRVDAGYAADVFEDGAPALGAVLTPLGARLMEAAPSRGLARALDEHWREAAAGAADSGFARVRDFLAAAPGTSAPPARAPPSRRWRTLASLARLPRQVTLVGTSGLIPGRSLVRTAPDRSVYLNVSQFPVFWERGYAWLDHRRDIRAAFFLHDVLPLKYPEFFRPMELGLHRARLRVMARRASGVIVSAEETKSEFEALLRREGWSCPPVLVAPLAASSRFRDSNPPDAMLSAHPYFVSIGTIEPRKNQLLLLQIWRELVRDMGEQAPKLVLAGARGWENENVVDMLERCESLQEYVIEAPSLSTPDLRRVLHGSRALLLPSFAEGFGLPAVEALALGVPVIASAVPGALGRGAGVLTLDPTDGFAWRQAIAERAAENRPIFGHEVFDKLADSPDSVWHWRHTEDFLTSI